MKENTNIRRYIRYLPLSGCIATGLIYLGIGVVAILSFLKLKNGGADEGSLLAFLKDYLAGQIVIWIILLGTLSYILWRFYEAITDPYAYGSGIKGLATRTGIALSTVADILIVYTGVQVLLGVGHIQTNGQPEAQRMLVSELLETDGGRWLVIATGGIVLTTALIQFLYGITGGYKERLGIAQFSAGLKHVIRFLAWAGYFARGIIIGIIGFFFLKAGILENPKLIVNTDKAFDFIGDHVGHVYFILAALGTICYGLFMFFLGITYDADKD